MPLGCRKTGGFSTIFKPSPSIARPLSLATTSALPARENTRLLPGGRVRHSLAYSWTRENRERKINSEKTKGSWWKKKLPLRENNIFVRVNAYTYVCGLDVKEYFVSRATSCPRFPCFRHVSSGCSFYSFVYSFRPGCFFPPHLTPTPPAFISHSPPSQRAPCTFPRWRHDDNIITIALGVRQ